MILRLENSEQTLRKTVYATFGVLLLLLFMPVMAAPASAASGLAHSSHVLVLNTEGTASANGQAGTFPTSSVTGAGYSVSFMAASSVTGIGSFNGYDTIVLWEYCNVGSDTTVQSALIAFLQDGGKVIVWDSDACSSEDGTQAGYGWLSSVGAVFTAETPGQTGSFGGTLTVKENNNFLSGITSSDLSNFVSNTDAVGDLNTVVSSSAPWCATLDGTNVDGVSGFASAYTAPGALTGASGALILYTGLDTDYISTSTGDAGYVEVHMILDQLAHGWGNAAYTSDLTCSVPVSGISLAPSNATNQVGGTHTVTAFVYDTAGAGVAGISVTFMVTSGPNAGITGTGTTDSTGHVTFNYADTGGAGTDNIVATFHDPTGALHTSNTAVKVWTPRTIGAPEFGASSVAVAAVALAALALLSRFRKPQARPSPF